MSAAPARAPLVVTPVPQTAPPVLSAAEVDALRRAPYVQDALAVDFAQDVVDDFGRQHTSTRSLPDVRRFTAQLAQALVETMGGLRPAPQLIRWCAPDVYSVLARRALVAARRPDHGNRRRPLVRRVVLCEPADGVAEASVVVAHHDRVRALALRLEGLDGRWVVTDLRLG